MARYTIEKQFSREEERALGRQLQALNEEARVQLNSANAEQWLSERAQEMTDAIYEGFKHENLISLFSNVVNVPWEQRVTWSEVRGMKAFWLARGGYIEASSVHKETAEVERDIVGFHVFENLEKLEANFGETASTLIDLGTERLDAEINSRFFTMVQEAVGVGHANYHAGSGVSLATVNEAIGAVRDASKQQNVAIVGRAGVLNSLMFELMGTSLNGSGFLPSTNEQIIRDGVLGTYLGAPLVPLVNYLDDTDQSYFPADEMYVIAPDASKWVFWGSSRSSSWVEDDLDYWHFRLKKETGGVIHHSDRIARIVDTSVAP